MMPTYIHDVSLIYGAHAQTSEVFIAWLTNTLSLAPTRRVYTRAAVDLGRREVFRRALLDGLMPCEVVIPWESRMEKLAGLSDQALAAVICLDEDLGVGVAIAMSRAPGPVEIRLEPEGVVLPFPNLQPEILPPISLGFAALAVKYGWVPGNLQPQLLAEEPRRVRAGTISVSSHEAPRPLRLPTLELRRARANSLDDLIVALEGNEAPESGAPQGVVVTAAPGTMDEVVTEAIASLRQHRTFSESFVYAEEKCSGQIAFLYPGPLNFYPGAGSALRALRKRAPINEHPVALSAWIQAENERILKKSGVHPDVFIGQSLSQIWIGKEKAVQPLLKNALMTEELDGEMVLVRKALSARGYIDEATGSLNWQAWLVLGPLELTQEAISGESMLEIAQIHTDHECVVVGPEDAFDRALVEILNSARMHATQLTYANALHTSIADGRIYAGFDIGSCDDVRPRVIEAWEAGVRVFVDLGPRSWFAGWVGRILEDRPHLAVSMDNPILWGTRQKLRALTTLAAHGVPVDFDAALGLFHRVELPSVPLPDLEERHMSKEGAVFALAHATLDEQREATRLHLQYIHDQTASFEAYLDNQLKAIQGLERVQKKFQGA